MEPGGRPSSDLVSGPDLGGGYLHQLSVDRLGESTTFTHHAQIGGQDAGGPPSAPLDRLGFVHPPSPCMFGGPRCWHRRFLLPFAELPRVRFAYQRCRFVLAAMLDQVRGAAPVPVAPVLREIVHRVHGPLLQDGVPWYVGGSTAAWLLGAPIRPNDVDLGTDRAGVDRLAALLADYLIEPLAPTDWGPGRLVRGARAFVGTPQEGARVEWSVPPGPSPAGSSEEFGGRVESVRTIDVDVAGSVVRVTRPEYGLVRAAERARTAVLPIWRDVVRQRGVDRPLLEALLVRSTLDAAARSELFRSVAE